MIGGFPRSRENGVSMWILPSLRSAPFLAEHSQSLDEPRTPLLSPDGLLPDLAGVVELGGGLALLTDDDDSDTASFDRASGEETDTAVASGPKIDSMGCRCGEAAGLDPVNRVGEDLVAKRCREGRSQLAEVGA
jgi:hypothetical protein